MPARAHITPDSTNRPNLTRLTRIPANCAASGASPVATMARPALVACSTTPKMTARTPKITAE